MRADPVRAGAPCLLGLAGLLGLALAGCGDETATARSAGDANAGTRAGATGASRDADADPDYDPYDYDREADAPAGVEGLKTLGYVDWVASGSTDGEMPVGTTLWDRERAWSAPSLFKSMPRHDALLMDMDGTVLHTWRLPGDESLPSLYAFPGPDGALFVLSKFHALWKLDWDGRIVWERDLAAHHDVQVGPDGRLYTFTETLKAHEHAGETLWIRDNAVVVLSPDGRTVSQVGLAPLLAGAIEPGRLEKIREAMAAADDDTLTKTPGSDVFHANSLEVLERDVPGLGEASDVLLSLRNLNRLVVVSLEEPRVMWMWGQGELDRQHAASIVEHGRVLCFDNGTDRGWSRVIEIDPPSGEIVWDYRGPEGETLYSSNRSAAQRLPNGNTVVVVSNSGRALEVTRDGEVVWEFWTPDIDPRKDRRAAFYRLPRLTAAQVAGLPLSLQEDRQRDPPR